MKSFGKYLSVIVTPFKEDMSVDYNALKTIGERMIKGGVEGFIVAATGGESATVTLPERVEMTKFMKKEFGDKVDIITATGTNDTVTSIENTKAIEEAGADAALLIAPYYNTPTQEGLYQHYKAVAESTRLPIFLYNSPFNTGVKIAPETVGRLAKIPNICAIKDASENIDNLTCMINETPESFQVYTGDDNMVLPALSIGAYGLISVVAQVIPDTMGEMMQLFRDGKLTEAAKMHRDLFDLIDVMFITTNPIPVKVALNLLGLNAGTVRLPLTMPDEDTVNAIRKTMEDYDLINQQI